MSCLGRRPHLLSTQLAVGLALGPVTSTGSAPLPRTYRVHLPTVTMAVTPPLAATIYYMDAADPGTLYSLGCNLGQRDLSLRGTQDSIVVLDFGKPVAQGRTYGTSIFSFSFASTSQIAVAAEQFGQGY